MPDRVHLDHVGVITADLDAAARAYEAMGFDLAPRSIHTSSGPDGAERSSGTANQCAMLAQGYVELLTVIDPDADSFNRRQIAGFLDAWEGVHIVALGTGDAEATRAALAAADVDTHPIRELRRRIDGADGGGEAWFRLLMPEGLETGDAVTFFIEHRTRDLVWSSGPNRHRNGARTLAELTFVVADPATAARRYATALGREPIAGDAGLRFQLADSALVVADAAQAAHTCGRPIETQADTYIAGFAVSVDDATATADLLTWNGVPFTRPDGRLTVGPDHACGTFVQFVEAS